MKYALNHFRVLACASALGVFFGPVFADTFPQRPVRAIVPFTAGSIDTLTRALGKELSKAWSQPVVVENRPGAGGTIGTAVAAKAEPDGYTWLMVTNPHSINLSLYPDLPYDTLKDFEPVILLATTPMVLSANPSVPASSIQELVSLAKSRPDEIVFASAGVGSATHLACELFKAMTKLPTRHIPYKGSAPAVTDLIGGRVHYMCDPLPSSLPHIRSGKFKALAITEAKRSPLLPELPTLQESGVQGYDAKWWGGIVVPAGTPQEVIKQIQKDAAAAMRSPQVKDLFTKLGYDVVASSTEQFKKHFEAEVARWARVIKEANVRVQ